ncbi:MAG: hypothetical protein ACYTG5_09055 [Planctomycetota bacterium]|jgi:hypothetical protein
MKLARQLLTSLSVLSINAQADLTAQLARDSSLPTDHRVLQGASETSLAGAVADGYRITDLEIADPGNQSFNAVLVANSGDYATDSWWYYGLSASEVNDRLDLHQARLIDLDPYEVSGQARFACVMVDNTGSKQKSWWWYQGTSSTLIGQQVANNIARIIDLDRYSVAGQEFFSAIMIANSSSDARGWWWLLGTDKAAIEENIQRNGSRLWDIERNPDGSFDSILVLDRAPRHDWSWAIDLPASDLQELLIQSGHRLIDIEAYEDGGPKLAVALISNRIELSGSVESFGSGCGGLTPHSQSFDGSPKIGESITFRSHDGSPASPTVLVLGFSASSWGSVSLPFDLSAFSAPGCLLYSSVQRTYSSQSDDQGVAESLVGIPNDQTLVGFTFYTQFVTLDPSSNLLGLTTSNAHAATIGNL